MGLALSILDQSPIRPGTTPAQAVAETIDLAKLADELGYKRYWVAEHHSAEAYAGPAPEILIAKLASETHQTRVGSGGVMLTHYSPLKVAEQFRMLETLFPGRIDLGIGRALGAQGKAIQALGTSQCSPLIDTFPYKLDLLLRYLEDAAGAHSRGLPLDHEFYGVCAMPTGVTLPEIWVLGSGFHSAVYAARLGQAFCHAYFLGTEGDGEIGDLYRQHFRPSPRLTSPRLALGVHAIVAESDEEAMHLSLMRNLWVLRLSQGVNGPFPSLRDAQNQSYTVEERAALDLIGARGVTGTPGEVRDRLHALATDFGAEELLVVTITHDHSARRRSYELLAEAFELRRRPQLDR